MDDAHRAGSERANAKPAPVTITTVGETILAVVLVVVAGHLFDLAWKAHRQPGGAQVATNGLLIGGGVLEAFALSAVIACWGMWKDRD